MKVVKTWFKSKLIRNIKVFIRFANFAHCYIRNINKIVVLLILKLKIIMSAFINNFSEVADFASSKILYGSDIKTKNLLKTKSIK